MTSIYNQIRSDVVYPSCLKTARVISIFKEGDNSHPCNYTPISLVPLIVKFFEKPLSKRIIIFAIANKI